MSSLPRLEVAETPPPETLGRYELRDPLGQGGMAVVYRAWDPLLQVERAIKLLHLEASSHRALRQRFVTEASTLTRLVHPNVLRIYDVGEDGDRCWYAMDLVPEGAAQRRIERHGPFAAAEALHITFQILCALGAAHNAGIVHRDIKPHNVLLRGDGTALLGDFGSARQAAVEELTRTGDVLGTVGYMAPEQRNDSRGTPPAADIYSVGATLFGLVTGRAPLGLFEGEIDGLFLARLHPEIREVLRTATRYRPEHRFPSARHMALEIARAHDRLLGTTGPDSARNKWMARYDLLIETCSMPSVPPGGGSFPGEPTRGATLAPERSFHSRTARPAIREVSESTPKPVRREQAPSTFRSLWSSAMRAGASLLQAFSAGKPSHQTVAGIWEGRVQDVLPIRIELEQGADGHVTGWVITTGMRGQVVMHVDGWWTPASATLDLHEVSERPDRARYFATLQGERLEGTIQPVEKVARPLSFTLDRRIADPSGPAQG